MVNAGFFLPFAADSSLLPHQYHDIHPGRWAAGCTIAGFIGRLSIRFALAGDSVAIKQQGDTGLSDALIQAKSRVAVLSSSLVPGFLISIRCPNPGRRPAILFRSHHLKPNKQAYICVIPRWRPGKYHASENTRLIKSCSILGCGWLGLPLARYLITRGFNIKGSTTREERMGELQRTGIRPYHLQLGPELWCLPRGRQDLQRGSRLPLLAQGVSTGEMGRGQAPEARGRVEHERTDRRSGIPLAGMAHQRLDLDSLRQE